MFGKDDLLLNNIAWRLRRFPIFPVFSDGKCQVQPFFAQEIVDRIVTAASTSNRFAIDAAEPETMSFEEMLRMRASKMRVSCGFLHTPPSIELAPMSVGGRMMRYVVLARDKVDGLMAELLVSDEPPAGKTRCAHWLQEYLDCLGLGYQSVPQRNFRT